MKTKMILGLMALLIATNMWAKSQSDSIILYTAPAKLVEQTDYDSAGFHPSEFESSNPVVEHSFKDGVGTIAFSAPLTNLKGHAFYKDSTVETISLPNSITSTGMAVFYECKNLRQINFPKNLKTIGTDYLTRCIALDSVYLYDKVEEIQSSAFAGCIRLREVRLSNKLDYIRTGAFSGCTALFSLDVPKDVITIEYGAFKGICNVVYKGSATGSSGWGNKVLNGYAKYPLVLNDDSYNHNTILACSPEAQDTIDLGYGYKYIKKNAFEGCALLTVIVMKGMITIDAEAFKGCTGLQSIICNEDTPPTCVANTFDGMDTTIPLYVPDGKVADYQVATGWSAFSKNTYPISAPTAVGNVNDNYNLNDNHNHNHKVIRDGQVVIEVAGCRWQVTGYRL